MYRGEKPQSTITVARSFQTSVEFPALELPRTRMRITFSLHALSKNRDATMHDALVPIVIARDKLATGWNIFPRVVAFLGAVSQPLLQQGYSGACPWGGLQPNVVYASLGSRETGSFTSYIVPNT